MIKKAGILPLCAILLLTKSCKSFDTETARMVFSPQAETQALDSLPGFYEPNLQRYKALLKSDEISPLNCVIFVNMNLDLRPYAAGSVQIIDDPNDETALINRYYRLSGNISPDLVPVDEQYGKDPSGRKIMLQPEAFAAFAAMHDDMEAIGLDAFIRCGFREPSRQPEKIYCKDYRTVLQSMAAYHSEHNSGFAVDMRREGRKDLRWENSGKDGFKNSGEYKWMIKNAYKYGWILRYPKGKETITGVTFEPWHWRYVGVNLATYMHENDIATLEEYYALNMEKLNYQ